jgi:hypothetical protein
VVTVQTASVGEAPSTMLVVPAVQPMVLECDGVGGGSHVIGQDGAGREGGGQRGT